MKNYYIINEENLNKIVEITGSDYDNKNGMIEESYLENIIEDLICEYHNIKEELDDLKENLEDNYTLKQPDDYDFYGVSRNDF